MAANTRAPRQVCKFDQYGLTWTFWWTNTGPTPTVTYCASGVQECELMGSPELKVDEQRYEGKLLLRLLDCYVLALTGNLDPEMETNVAMMVEAAYGGGPDWKPTLTETVKAAAQYRRADSCLVEISTGRDGPVGFRRLAVSDANFVPMIDPAWRVRLAT